MTTQIGAQFHEFSFTSPVSPVFNQKATYRIEQDREDPLKVSAYNEATHNRIGHLWWHGPEESDPNSIGGVRVLDQHQGRGVATAMLQQAQGINPDLHHSRTLTDDGRDWSAKHPI